MEASMFDLIGATVGMIAIMVSVVAIAGALQLSLVQRLVFGAVAGVWVGLASGLAAAGALVFSPDQKVPLIGVLVAAPLLITAALWLGSARVPAALMAVPMPLLIGLTSFRGPRMLVLAL